MTLWIYRLIFLPGLLLAAPFYLRRMRRRGGYGLDWKHRLGAVPLLKRPDGGRVRVWLQAVSVGEILAAEPLARRLCEDGRFEMVVSTTTSTGYALARERLSSQAAAVCQFPLDFQPFSARAWERLKPDLAVLMEGELWPEHLHQARKRGCPTLLINARLSDRSFRRYRRLRWLARPLLSKLERVLAASEIDRERFATLGLDPARLSHSGNLKCDFDPGPELSATERHQLRRELGFAGEPNRPLILGASTWPGEEDVLIDWARRRRDLGRPVDLLLCPRHAERRERIRALLVSHRERAHFRSSGPAPREDYCVSVADTTGELRHFLQLADAAFIGKSLPPHHEGQTPVEAAALGVPALFGPGMANFRAIARELARREAAWQVDSAEALGPALDRLLADPEQRDRMSRNAKAWHRTNRGALDHTFEVLLECAGAPPPDRR